MLAIGVFIYLIVILFKRRDVNLLRRDLFTLTVILCLIFFNSDDPFVKIQLYIYPMILSIFLSLFVNRRINSTALISTLILIICLLIPLIMIQTGIIDDKFLLLKQSNTDVMNIYGQLIKPTIDFTVIKHFLYLVAYILFVVLNSDLYSDDRYIKKLINDVVKWFKILIICLILEWAFVNALGGFNDRQIMNDLFSLNGTFQTSNWYTWNSYSVCLWLSERSAYSIIVFYYLILLKKESLKASDWIWMLLSAVACYCTGSSTVLVITIAFIAAEFVVIVIKNKKASQIAIMTIVAAFGLFFLINYFSVYSSKLLEFINNEDTWGSGHFRAQSIELGIEAIKKYPLFGVGIGTVYAHSMLIQTLGNIGIIGVILSLWIHQVVCPVRLNFRNVVSIVFFVGISFGAFMVQHFTSPVIILIFIILHSKGDISDARENTKSDSLLLVRG